MFINDVYFYIRAHYLALPAQAVECRLANIVPVGGMWSRRAAQLLFQMTKDKAIAAIVTSSKVVSMIHLCYHFYDFL